MAIGMRHFATISFLFGAVSFILGVIAENLKPEAGTPIHGKNVTICNYSSASSQYTVLGFLSLAFFALSTIVGYFSLSHSYNKKAIPRSALYATATMTTFFYITMLWASGSVVFILWPTLTELLHHTRNVHKGLAYDCPTAKTGMLGGGALLSLSSCLLWLVCLMLAKNAREDYFDELEEAQKGEKTQIINVDDQHLGSEQE